jgi:prolyl 4-hydroxylase
MVNYTKLGYIKMRAPDNVFQLIKEFWDLNKENQKVENWPTG